MTKQFQLTPDDPKLTAYALGELEPDEIAAVEAAVGSNPELRAVVDDIRVTAAEIESALQAEAADALPQAPAENPVPVFQSPPDEYEHVNGRKRPSAPARLLRFPQLYYVVGGLAAACFAIMAALHQPPPPVERRVYREYDLRAGGGTAADASAVVVALPAAADQDPSAIRPAPGLLEQVDAARKAIPPMPPPAGTLTLGPGPAITFNDSPVTATPPLRPGSMVFAPAGSGGSPASAAGLRLPTPTQVAQSKRAAEEAKRRWGTDTATSGTVTLSEGTAKGLASTSVPVSAGGTMTFGSAGKGSSAVDARGLALGSAGNSGTDILGSSLMPRSSPTDLYPGPRRRGAEFEPPISPLPRSEHNTESYAFVRDNEFLGAAQNPLSTFSIDVDTASYANVRRFLQAGQLPPADAVRIEELINYFPYRYAPPPANTSDDNAAPFAAAMEVADAPWAPSHRLVRIGLKGREVAADARPAANLVFLLDVSGSMNQPSKLPLVKQSMRLLLGKLRTDDRVAIVTYAGNSGLALPSTPVSRSREIIDALESLHAGGSTNGAMGIQLAYDIAKANRVADGVNRVILCTDGDFNVGVTSQGELVRLVEEKAKSGVFLTVLGFGMGNLKDSTLEVLADKGNGNYGYIDTAREAEKLLVEQMSGTLVTIAKDVKIQVDFNPTKVSAYRLIGYENRMLKAEDFNNDKVDAGEIGAGHTVTALYEVVLAASDEKPAVAMAEESKYQPRAAAQLPAAIADELLTLRIRYKEPGGDVSRKLEFPLRDNGGRFEAASADFKFTSALAAFGMILRDSPHKGAATITHVLEWATSGAASALDDPRGYRSEFLDLARRAQALLVK
ncbi:MAG: von Willebrand factor type A domain-containing protein [Opitutaceae bacterium]|nr:von Willebrand factor type A domain-containing protein [Opitutaceae bacterium]